MDNLYRRYCEEHGLEAGVENEIGGQKKGRMPLVTLTELWAVVCRWCTHHGIE